MPSLILPGNVHQQPQSVPRLASGYQDAELLAPCIDGTGGDIARGNHLLPGASPARSLRQQGYTLNFNGSSHYLASARAIKPSPQFTVFVWVRPAALNTTYTRIIETDYKTGFYLGSNTSSQYCWIVNNTSLEGCVGGQQVAGQRDFVCGVFDGSSRILYVNGVQVASSAATAPSTPLPVYAGKWSNGPGYYWNGDIDTVGLFNRALAAAEIWSLYQSPWQLFKAPGRRLWSAPALNNLAGAGLVQANSGGTADIIQAHALAILSTGQPSTSETGAITQNHALATVDCIQANTASSAGIASGLALSTVPCVQWNAFSTVRAAQTHALAAAALKQNNWSAPTAVTQDHAIIGLGSAQQNAFPTAIITLGTGVLAASSLTQINLGGSGAIALGGAVPDAFLNAISTTKGIRKPGIPPGTPEWLKTFLEIISGRRGNRIAVPAQEILTFSASPTKAECEALYAYVNSVRASIADLINRLDG
jgi:hypothetical protein